MHDKQLKHEKKHEKLVRTLTRLSNTPSRNSVTCMSKFWQCFRNNTNFLLFPGYEGYFGKYLGFPLIPD